MIKASIHLPVVASKKMKNLREFDILKITVMNKDKSRLVRQIDHGGGRALAVFLIKKLIDSIKPGIASRSMTREYNRESNG